MLFNLRSQSIFGGVARGCYTHRFAFVLFEFQMGVVSLQWVAVHESLKTTGRKAIAANAHGNGSKHHTQLPHCSPCSQRVHARQSQGLPHTGNEPCAARRRRAACAGRALTAPRDRARRRSTSSGCAPPGGALRSCPTTTWTTRPSSWEGRIPPVCDCLRAKPRNGRSCRQRARSPRRPPLKCARGRC